MDISTVIDIPLPAAPLQPWIRLAHRGGSPPGIRNRSALRRRLRDYELVLPVTGGGMWWWWRATGCSHHLPVGWCAFIPPGIEHAYGHVDGEHLALHFDLHHVPDLHHPDMIEPLGTGLERDDGEAIPWFRIGRGDDDALLVPAAQAVDAARVTRRIERMIELIQTAGPDALRTQREGGAILLDLLGELDRSRAAGGAVADQRILRAIAAVPTTVAPSIAGLAERSGLSEGAFRAAFVATTGETPHRFFERRRIDHALRLLSETDLPVAEIAAAVGYDDPFHFSRACKRVTGKAPSAWRN